MAYIIIGLTVFLFGFLWLLNADYENLGLPMTISIIGSVLFSIGLLSILFT